MKQMTLISDKLLEKFFCAKCSWIGFNPNIEKHEGYNRVINIETCPKCKFVCYTRESSHGVINVYPALKKKLQRKI